MDSNGGHVVGRRSGWTAVLRRPTCISTVWCAVARPLAVPKVIAPCGAGRRLNRGSTSSAEQRCDAAPVSSNQRRGCRRARGASSRGLRESKARWRSLREGHARTRDRDHAEALRRSGQARRLCKAAPGQAGPESAEEAVPLAGDVCAAPETATGTAERETLLRHQRCELGRGQALRGDTEGRAFPDKPPLGKQPPPAVGSPPPSFDGSSNATRDPCHACFRCAISALQCPLGSTGAVWRRREDARLRCWRLRAPT